MHPDGSVEKFSSTGARNPKTSATAEKLAAGHGRWERISNASPGVPPERAARAVVPQPATPEPERKSVPAPVGSRYRKPMDFNEAPAEDIPKYAADPEWHFQQKVDGVRAQLVIEPSKKPWFRSKSGEQLQSTTAAPVTRAVLDHIGIPQGDGPGYVVDGEVVDGKWHVFDMTVDSEEKLPWETRMDRAKAWADTIGSERVSALPVAKTESEKLALAHAVRVNGGEGVMMKRRGSSYDYGSRVSHSLKAKYVSTADVVISKMRPDGKDSAEISVYDNGVLRRIGSVNLGGKEKDGQLQVGDVVEVNYLYSMPGSHNLVQSRIMKKRPDKRPEDTSVDQLRKVSKEVLDERAMRKQELRQRVETSEARVRAEAERVLPPSQAPGKIEGVEPDYHWPSDGKATPERAEGRRRINDAQRLAARADDASRDAMRSKASQDYARAAQLAERAANALDAVPGFRDRVKQLREDAAWLRQKAT